VGDEHAPVRDPLRLTLGLRPIACELDRGLRMDAVQSLGGAALNRPTSVWDEI
jgi:hypothetical protein